MKILIDLQSIQGTSKNRGIGRYSLSLSQELLRQASRHEVYLLLNSNMLDEIENIHNLFDGLIPQDRIKIFESPKNIPDRGNFNLWRIKVAEKIREQFISSLCPDITYITSIFEGGDALSSIGEFANKCLTAVTLYDLIPFIYYDSYIKNCGAPNFFFQKMQYLKKSNLLITLSDSGTQEAMDHLAFPRDKIINCSVGLDQKFQKYDICPEKKFQLKKQYGINRNFIFYIGGIDFRKNVIGLIEAFSLLPNREKFQLVIIVSTEEHLINPFNNLFKKQFNLKERELILISYVSEDILLTLYNTCSVFVFPSLHEGFGLPIIEAMACGAPTIGSNFSSIPEAVGCTKALFDPKNPQSIANKIHQVLTDKDFCNFLKRHGQEQIKKFTWTNAAKKALNAFEELYTQNNKKKYWIQKRKRIAYISPLPSEKSGIAYYSAQLIPELACFYEIILITEQNTVDDLWLKGIFKIHDAKWLRENVNSFDVLLYHFGNSSHHGYMIELFNAYPGVVVLHDFYISGLLNWLDTYAPIKSIFNRGLYHSHGFPALIYQEKNNRINTLQKYPCNFSILKKATGIIVHSKYSIELAKKWYGNNIIKKFKLINPLAHNKKISLQEKNILKKKLGFNENNFLICSFGSLDPTKLNHRLISSCLDCLLKNDSIYLIFIGKKCNPSYNKILSNIIKKNNLNKRIQFRNFSDNQMFKKFLFAADAAIQLRAHSRRETSDYILNCLSHGIPTIANAHGSIKELPDDVIIKLKDNFTDLELSIAINTLYDNFNLRSELSRKSTQYIKNNCHPAQIGKKFYHIIEDFDDNNKLSETYLINDLLKNNIPPYIQQKDILYFSKIIAANRQSNTYPQLLLDVSYLVDNKKNLELKARITLLKRLLNTSSIKFRPEPIYFNKEKNCFFYAYNYTTQLLNLALSDLKDLPIDIYDNDIFISLFPTGYSKDFLCHLKNKNINIYMFLFNQIIYPIDFLYEISKAFVCFNRNDFDTLNNYVQNNNIRRNKRLKISIIKDEETNDLCEKLFEIICNDSWKTIELKKANV